MAARVCVTHEAFKRWPTKRILLRSHDHGKIHRPDRCRGPIPMPNISTDLIAPSRCPGKKPEEAIVLSFKDKLFANLASSQMARPRPTSYCEKAATRARESC